MEFRLQAESYGNEPFRLKAELHACCNPSKAKSHAALHASAGLRGGRPAEKRRGLDAREVHQVYVVEQVVRLHIKLHAIAIVVAAHRRHLAERIIAVAANAHQSRAARARLARLAETET